MTHHTYHAIWERYLENLWEDERARQAAEMVEETEPEDVDTRYARCPLCGYKWTVPFWNGEPPARCPSCGQKPVRHG